MPTFRKRNNKWEFTVYTRDRYINGKRELIYKVDFKTKKEAERTVALLMTEIEKRNLFQS